MKNRLLAFLFSVSTATTFAQQDPIYAQYINNPLSINPAFAGSNKMLNASVQYRTQWAGLEANPVTFNFNAHMSAVQNKIGIGLQAVQDKIGDVSNTEIQSVYSYRIELKETSFFFGMQAGFTRYTSTPSMLNIKDPGDPAFNSFTETKFNTGVGLLLKSNRYVLGLSVPRLLPSRVSQGGQSFEVYQQHYYLYGSYVFFISPTVRFKPSALIRITSGQPVSADLNANFTLKEKFTAGVFVRNFKTPGLFLQAASNNFRFGYVFEVPVGSSTLNFVSHELMVGISMGVFTYHDKVVKTF